MPKHPNITITLPADASNGDIVLTCLRALAANNLGHELEAFANDIEKAVRRICAKPPNNGLI